MKIYNLTFLLLFPFLFGCNESMEFPASSSVTHIQQKQKGDKAGAANIVFKSADGGQTWEDISEGLPEDLQDSFESVGFFANESGLHLRAGNAIYRSQPNSTAPFWEKEIFPGKHSSIAPGKTGIFACNYDGQFLQKINGSNVWSRVYTNFQENEVNTVFETAGGTVLIGSNYGLFKSTDNGKTWKQVHFESPVTKLAESNGVLMATSQHGILRSADDGENWTCVLNEGGVGIDIERINGGFAAINYNTESRTRRVRTSYDNGKTWQSIDAGLPPNLAIASIIEAGEYFFCGHPTGIFRSSDKGRTWKRILCSIESKVFNLFVSGNVIYAIPRNGGC